MPPPMTWRAVTRRAHFPKAEDMIYGRMSNQHSIDSVSRPSVKSGLAGPDSVLMITPLWTRDGGVSAHVKESAELLARHGIRVVVLVARIESRQRAQCVTVLESSDLCKTDVPMDRRLGDALSVRPAMVHMHQVDDPDVVEVMQRKAPVVVSAHGFTACTSGVHYFRPGQQCTRAHGPGCVPNLLARGCAHMRNLTSLPARYRYATRGLQALTRADLAVSYSSCVDGHLAANGVARRKIVPYFPTMPAKLCSEDAQRQRVVFAGRVVTPKGVGVLIRAARDVDADFLICGEGRQLEAMRRLARRLGMEDRIFFRGWLEPDELAQEFANASVVVVPSLWPEPFGIVGIEAFAAGRPAIASDTGGICDWLDDGVSGLLVSPGDARGLARALNELLADPARRRSMGIEGKKTVAARFSPENHVAAIADCYRLARSTWELSAAA
jgi:glycosyltransferase involved in cell wall biosynthesis